jgi:hypothetical protein
VIEMRRAQLSFGDGLIAEEVSDLREDWMEHADQVLADEEIVAAVYEALARHIARAAVASGGPPRAALASGCTPALVAGAKLAFIDCTQSSALLRTTPAPNENPGAFATSRRRPRRRMPRKAGSKACAMARLE